MTESNTLAGRPIRGEISYYSCNPAEQKPIGAFLAALDAVFAFPEVEAVRWQQYTPYFNDGDACEFGISSARVRISSVDEYAGDYDDGYLNAWDIEWGNDVGPSKYNEAVKYPQIGKELHAAIDALETALEGGSHKVDLLKYFGDPAEVTATREGFDVEYYDHD